MPRKARVVFPNIPHHITQRGNRRQRIFFSEDDYAFYLTCIREFAARYQVSILAYCLMTNHVHHILVPSTTDGLHKMLKASHASYAHRINKRFDWTGHLWQARFFSSPLDEDYLLTAVRYVELNPVRANMVDIAEEYKWSSAHHHVVGDSDTVLDRSNPWNTKLPGCKAWRTYLQDEDLKSQEFLRCHLLQNKPCGAVEFIKKLEQLSGCNLGYNTRGRPRKK